VGSGGNNDSAGGGRKRDAIRATGLAKKNPATALASMKGKKEKRITSVNQEPAALKNSRMTRSQKSGQARMVSGNGRGGEVSQITKREAQRKNEEKASSLSRSIDGELLGRRGRAPKKAERVIKEVTN